MSYKKRFSVFALFSVSTFFLVYQIFINPWQKNIKHFWQRLENKEIHTENYGGSNIIQLQNKIRNEEILLNITQEIEQNKLTLIKLEPKTDVIKEEFINHPFSVSVIGNYINLFQFISKIITKQVAVQVCDLKIIPNENQNTLNDTLVAELIICYYSISK